MIDERYYMLALRLEKHLINPDDWSEEIINNYPDDIQEEIRLCIKPYQTDENGMIILPHPTGIGHDEEVGWFCIGCGQGPYIIWLEKDPYE